MNEPRRCNQHQRGPDQSRLKGTRMAKTNSSRMTREEYRHSVRKDAKGNFICINCGKSSYRNISGTNKKLGIENKYCSMACRKEHAAKLRTPAFSKVEQCICKQCGNVWFAKQSKSFCSDSCSKDFYSARYATTDWSKLTCKSCGAIFAADRRNGRPPRYCKTCDKSVKDEVRRKCKRASRSKRKALEKTGYAQAFDPIEVLERDKWKCKLCGVNTPRHKRGSIDQDAPELDHIIPLSKGGAHTKENTQCACRSCNCAKSGRPLGQLLLIG